MAQLWHVAVHKLSGQINSIAECDTLAVYLQLIERYADPVKQIRERQSTGPSEVALDLMKKWLTKSAGQSLRERKEVLLNTFKELKRQDLVLLLNELIKVLSDCAAHSWDSVLI